MLDAARTKIAAGFDYAPYARVGIASEGDFGPHPYIPYLAVGRELIMPIDRERGLELTGHVVSPETNYGHVVVSDMKAATAFAERSKFPDHDLIVLSWASEKPEPDLALFKDVGDLKGLEKAVSQVVAQCGATLCAGFAVNARPVRIPDLM